MKISGAVAQQSASHQGGQRREHAAATDILTGFEVYRGTTGQLADAGHDSSHDIGGGHPEEGLGVLAAALAFGCGRCREWCRASGGRVRAEAGLRKIFFSA